MSSRTDYKTKPVWELVLTESAPHGHLVQFYGADERQLISNVTDFLGEGLRHGDGIIVIATAEHVARFSRELTGRGLDAASACESGQLLFWDAQETLAKFMVDGQPDETLFETTIATGIESLQAPAKRVRAYGEMVGVLWKAGQHSAAVRLEQCWNKLLHARNCALFCAYPVDIFSKDFHATNLDGILCEHTHLVPTVSNCELERAVHHAMDDLLGPKAPVLRSLMKLNFRPAWAEVPSAEGIILWIRNNLPDHADRILARAHHYYETAVDPVLAPEMVT